MTLQEAVKAVFSKYSDFSGRARRSEYWYFALAYVVVLIAAQIVVSVLGKISGVLGMLGGIALLLGVLAIIVPSLAVSVRRMHDTDHSGWWVIVPIVPLIFALTEGTPGDNRFGPSPKGSAGLPGTSAA